MNALITNRKAHFLTEWPEPEIDIKQCNWYHYFPFLKDHPDIKPHYDLRNNLDDLLLPRDMREKSYLDIGTANGFLSFEMEKRGATVVSFDVDEDEDMEQIPYAGSPDRRAGNKMFNRMFHRGYWYAHRHFKSKAKVVYGNVMRMPDDLGTYDVVMMGSILQHLRDPFVAIQCADRHVKDTLIICEAYCKHEEPVMMFRAQPKLKCHSSGPGGFSRHPFWSMHSKSSGIRISKSMARLTSITSRETIRCQASPLKVQNQTLNHDV
jgi:SAM-dependent methyltransferase